jgi:SP family general alpha glucoside:H+ symporter-like MFS transporter
MSAREIGTSGYRDTSPSGDSMKKQTRTEYLESTGGDFATSDAKRMNAEATIATEAEHDLDFWAAVKKYKKAIAWSMIISASIVMEGYDTTLLGSFFGFPAFRRKYGTYINEEVGYQLSSKWQTGYVQTNETNVTP